MPAPGGKLGECEYASARAYGGSRKLRAQITGALAQNVSRAQTHTHTKSEGGMVSGDFVIV